MNELHCDIKECICPKVAEIAGQKGDKTKLSVAKDLRASFVHNASYGKQWVLNLDTMVAKFKTELDLPNILPLSSLLFDREKYFEKSNCRQIL